MAIDALLVARDPDEVDVYENTALMYRLGQGTTLRLTRIDPKTPAEHLKGCKEYVANLVVLRDPSDKGLVMEAVAAGIPHVIFMRDPSPLFVPRHESRTLFQLQPNGKFVLFDEPKATQ